MKIEECVLKNRSYRKFVESEKIPCETIEKWLDIARKTPATANIQPFRFFVSSDKKTNLEIFNTVGWAKKLKNYSGPEEGERPSAYVVLCFDKESGGDAEKFGIDAGIIGQSLLLLAVNDSYGGIFIKSFNKEKMNEILNLGERFEPYLLIALGKPDEEIILEDAENTKETSYYRDEKNIHHVPKIKLQDLIVGK